MSPGVFSQCALSHEAVVYRETHPSDYHLLQVADHLCTLELVTIKFERHALTATDRLFFGSSAPYSKRNFLKPVQRKRMG